VEALFVAHKCNHVISATSISLNPTLNNTPSDDDADTATVVTSNCAEKQFHVTQPQLSLVETAQALFGTTMPQYLNALTLVTNQAIADTGATSFFIVEGAIVDNKRVAELPLTIKLPDCKTIHSTHVCDINIQGLPTILTGHIVLSLTIALLIGIWPLCKAGCTVTFDNEKCNVKFNGKIISTGFKDPTTDLWMLHIPSGQVETTQPLVAASPISAHQMFHYQVRHALAPATEMVPGALFPSVMTVKPWAASMVSQSSPCIP
jgi:hypothetical protein